VCFPHPVELISVAPCLTVLVHALLVHDTRRVSHPPVELKSPTDSSVQRTPPRRGDCRRGRRHARRRRAGKRQRLR
ncbi:hypothetical protein M885DRAFT_549453, partial [Pelagophyceae sp. CCMP2097]